MVPPVLFLLYLTAAQPFVLGLVSLRAIKKLAVEPQGAGRPWSSGVADGKALHGPRHRSGWPTGCLALQLANDSSNTDPFAAARVNIDICSLFRLKEALFISSA